MYNKESNVPNVTSELTRTHLFASLQAWGDFILTRLDFFKQDTSQIGDINLSLLWFTLHGWAMEEGVWSTIIINNQTKLCIILPSSADILGEAQRQGQLMSGDKNPVYPLPG